MTNADEGPDEVVMARLVLDDHAGPAPRITRERAAALIESALLELPEPEVAPVRVRDVMGTLRMLAMAAAALLVLVGGAAAARLLYQRLTQPAVTAATPALPAPAVVVQRAAPAPVAAEPADEEEVEQPAARPRTTASSIEREAAAPDDLLQRANRWRALGKFQQAAAIYTLVYQRSPGSLSAYVAEVAAASIELEHLAHASRARRLFERALQAQPAGALDLEARQGLALALRDLGDARGETAALRELVARHAGSPAAKRAELRLQELAKAAP
jgi:hypothetical protein